MSLTEFSQLPGTSRIWIHGFEPALSPEEQGTVRREMEHFVSGWESHGIKVESAFTLFENRFLITAAHVPAGISGCSKDSYFRLLRTLRDEKSLDCTQGHLVFYRTADGTIEAAPHIEVFSLVEHGMIGDRTIVFDTLLEQLGDLRQGGFEKEFQSSWHERVYREAS